MSTASATCSGHGLCKWCGNARCSYKRSCSSATLFFRQPCHHKRKTSFIWTHPLFKQLGLEFRNLHLHSFRIWRNLSSSCFRWRCRRGRRWRRLNRIRRLIKEVTVSLASNTICTYSSSLFSFGRGQIGWLGGCGCGGVAGLSPYEGFSRDGRFSPDRSFSPDECPGCCVEDNLGRSWSGFGGNLS